MRWLLYVVLAIVPGAVIVGLVVTPFVWLYRRHNTSNRVRVIRPTLKCMKGGRK